MKFIICSTWNGEGYSFQNSAEVLEFETEEDVQKHLEQLMKAQGEASIKVFGKDEPWRIEHTPLCITFENSEDAGSFQAFEFTDYIYGVIIQTNVNVIDIVDEEDWYDRIAMALDQADPDDKESDPEGYELDEEGRMFIPAYENDYDEQFIKLA